MHRIDGPGHDGNTFTEGDPVAGTPATTVTDDWLNAVQEEIAHVIETAGISLNKPDNTQLLQGLNALYGGASADTANLIINGNFRWWQRGGSGASFSLSGEEVYTADRWRVDTGTGGACTVTREQFSPGQSDVASESRYYLRIDQTTGGSSAPTLEQRVESVRRSENGEATVGVWLRVQSGTMDVTPSLVQRFGSGGSSAVTTTAPSAWTVTTTWTKFSWTATVPSISGKTISSGGTDHLALRLECETSTTFTLDVADVQLERGGNANPFVIRGEARELALCQRYYEKSYDEHDAPGAVAANGQSRWYGQGSAGWGLQERFCVSKFKVPDVTWYADDGTQDAIDWSGNQAVTSTSDASEHHTGYPNISGTVGADAVCRAHWIADAEL